MTKSNEIAKLRADLADARRKIAECVAVMDEQGRRIVELEPSVVVVPTRAELIAEVHRLKAKCGKLAGYAEHPNTCASRHLTVTEEPTQIEHCRAPVHVAPRMVVHQEPCSCGLVEVFADVNVGLVLPAPR